ncbi:hypothetical protein [Streptomyces avicenniae]|uniref:hypothetical protein n=1 Tax=Streptomyces avicenniae TaxID=500153 RepID=UPI00069C3393|nr:hypothetical protein [Streptomyces avicenniae]
MGSGRGLALAGALLAAALLSGCGSGGGGEGDDGAPPTGAGPAAELLTVSVAGGLAGGPGVFLAVAADGGLTTVAGTGAEVAEDALPPGDLATLTGLLEDGGFTALPPQTYDTPAPDAYHYTFVHDGRYVMADDASLTPPLDEVVAVLGPYLSAAG